MSGESLANPIFAEAHGERPFWPRRNWWLALLAILVLAGALRYPGYDFSLPYVEYRDESTFALSGQMIIDFGTAKPLGHHHYPPGIIHIYYLMLRLFHDPTTPPASVIWIVRLMAITVSLGIIALLGLFGYHAIGENAGLLGAAIWAITPLFVERSRWGTAEIFVAFFSILALYLAFIGTRFRRESWTTHATYALMLAILFKYHCVFLAPAVLFAPLWGGRISRRRVLTNTGRFVLFSAWLLLLTPLLDAFLSTQTFTNVTWKYHAQISELPSPINIIHNIRFAFAEFDWPYLFPGWLCLGLIVMDRKRRGRDLGALAFLGSALLLWVAGISFFGAHDAYDHAIRFLFTWVTLLVMLSGWGYALLLHALGSALNRYLPPYQRIGMYSAFLLLGLLFVPYVAGSVENLQRSLWEDPRNFVTHYMDRTVAASRYIISRDNSSLFNREWGGYAGETRFELASTEEPLHHPVQFWREEGVEYVILYQEAYENLSHSDPYDYLQETTRLKGWEQQPNYRSPTMVVLRLYPFQHEATGQLGPIRLIGYELDAEKTRPGESLSFHLYWQATAATEADYQVFNHLLDARGKPGGAGDGPPLPDPLLRRGTMDWDDPEEIIYSREYALALPEDLPPGEYSIVTGFYRRDTGQRLLSPTGEDALWVTRVVVE